jgi:hypothetical protein
MKRARPRTTSKTASRRTDGKVNRASTTKQPTPGWKGHPIGTMGWRNPRVPAVPATLDINLSEYYAAATLMGLVASQVKEPNKRWCRDWSLDMGRIMAIGARQRRKAGRG